MAIPFYLAKTAAEFASADTQPQQLAWMACHFSPYGTDLTNLPDALPESSLLILNDRTPVHGHDPQRILATLENAVNELHCSGILLDLQRPGSTETQKIVQALLSLSCPVCVSELYAQDLDCPVFLPPVPPNLLPEEYFAPWSGREIWLEAALTGIVCTVTESGTAIASADPSAACQLLHKDESLLCHYCLELTEDSCRITMRRTWEDLCCLLELAGSFGVTTAVGLYQELKAFCL